MNKKYKLSPKLQKLLGSVKLPKDFDEKKVLREMLEKKYFKNDKMRNSETDITDSLNP